MKVERRSPWRLRLGIAISADSLVVHAQPAALAAEVLTMALVGAPSAAGRWPELEAAFTELRAMIPSGARVTASIALVPPLVQLRRIELPPMKAEERRRVLCRDASRWFVGAREPYVADALPIPGAHGDVMAAAIPARYPDAIARAASGAQIEVRTLQAAPWAWSASVDTAQRGTTRALVVPAVGSVDVVWLARGAVTGIRRLRNGADAGARLDAVLADESAGLAVQRIPDGMAIAAAFADRARGPELLPEASRVSHRAAVVRRARWLGLVAATLLLAAAGVELWGVQRELALVRAERAELRGRVTRAMSSRDSATALEAQLGAVAGEVRDAPRWTAVVANLTQRLPDDAWLQSLAASGDSVALVGESTRAADVFEVLRRDPAIAGVRADAPIRREMTTDRAPVERFGLTLRLARSAFVAAPKETP